MYDLNENKTARMYNLHLINTTNCEASKHGMPLLDPVDMKPERLIGADKATKGGNRKQGEADPGAGVHFFLDDERFSTTWVDPLRYVSMLERFGCVLTPDYSLYLEMFDPVHRWNTYRARAVGRIWQDAGLQVVPTVSWCEEQSYEYSFEGIPQESTVAVSTVGLMDCEEGIELFKNGASQAARVLQPLRILCHGKPCDFDSGKAEVVWFPNDMQERFSELRKKKQEERRNNGKR